MVGHKLEAIDANGTLYHRSASFQTAIPESERYMHLKAQLIRRKEPEERNLTYLQAANVRCLPSERSVSNVPPNVTTMTFASLLILEA
jgi:hypothetical protein